MGDVAVDAAAAADYVRELGLAVSLLFLVGCAFALAFWCVLRDNDG